MLILYVHRNKMKIAQEIYNQIAQEIDSKNIDKGTWTRAVAESDGNKQKQKPPILNTELVHSHANHWNS